MEDLKCVDLVERVTDYLEGALAPDELARVRAHLLSCDGCAAHVEQMRAAVRALADIPPEQPSPAVEDALLDMFRQWAGNGPGA